jgi:hypothetical protein
VVGRWPSKHKALGSTTSINRHPKKVIDLGLEVWLKWQSARAQGSEFKPQFKLYIYIYTILLYIYT